MGISCLKERCALFGLFGIGCAGLRVSLVSPVSSVALLCRLVYSHPEVVAGSCRRGRDLCAGLQVVAPRTCLHVCS